MTIIGITGGTGAGKTTALGALLALDGTIIDADAVYHRLTEENPQLRLELEERFGKLYDETGCLERKKLGNIVFRDAAALSALNAITHRHVGWEIDRLLEVAKAQGKSAAAIDAIALLESGLEERCHCTVAITAPAAVRIQRIMKREGISEDYARMRVEAQKDAAYYNSHCDYVLENRQEDSAETFAQRAKELFLRILNEQEERM